jgi:UDP-galactopyranose mutase
MDFCTRYSCQILIKLEFSRPIFENPQTPNVMKIHPVGAELFHTDGRTAMKLIVAFRNFANAPAKRRADARSTAKALNKHYPLPVIAVGHVLIL